MDLIELILLYQFLINEIKLSQSNIRMVDMVLAFIDYNNMLMDYEYFNSRYSYAYLHIKNIY